MGLRTVDIVAHDPAWAHPTPFNFEEPKYPGTTVIFSVVMSSGLLPRRANRAQLAADERVWH
jgi:hypothetical protein